MSPSREAPAADARLAAVGSKGNDEQDRSVAANSTQSFTLDELERQRILDLNSGSQSAPAHSSEEMYGQGRSWRKSSDTDGSSDNSQHSPSPSPRAQRSVLRPLVSYHDEGDASQELEQAAQNRSPVQQVMSDSGVLSPSSLRDILSDGPDPRLQAAQMMNQELGIDDLDGPSQATQADPESLRDVVDQAPMVDAPSDISDFFEDELQDAPLEVATAFDTPRRRDNDFGPPSSFDDRLLQPVTSQLRADTITSGGSASIVQQTPAAGRGLTQLFQSSQDTPLLGKRKSTYISMKDSQKHRLTLSDEEASAEEDPDFPKIRQQKVSFAQDATSAAHSVMQRMRDRTLLRSSNGDDLAPSSGPSFVAQSSSFAHETNGDADMECMIIPASAEAVPSASTAASAVEIDEVITDSQPPPKEPVARLLPSIAESPSAATHAANLQNEANTLHTATTSASQMDDIDLLLSESGNEKVSTISDESLAQPQNKTTLKMSQTQSQFSTPQRCIGVTTRSKSLRPIAKNMGSLDDAGNMSVLDSTRRRGSRPMPLVAQTPRGIQTKVPMQTRRKRTMIDSSLPELEEIQQSPTASRGRAGRLVARSKRQRLDAEVEDSQVDVVPIAKDIEMDIDLELDPKLSEAITATESMKMSTEEEPQDQPMSSPLSSLISNDLEDQTLEPLEEWTKLSRYPLRVLALDATGQSFSSGTSEYDRSRAQGTSTVKVEFDDGEVANVDLDQLYPLDLRVDDVVRIKKPGFKKNLWTVLGLLKMASTTSYTDVLGNTHFNASIRGSQAVQTFSITDIQIPLSHSKSFAQRRLETKHEAEEVVGSSTSSRKFPLRPKSHSPVATKRRPEVLVATGLFHGLAISITLANTKDSTRRSLQHNIRVYGGVILQDGLESLFEPTTMSESYDIAPLRLTQTAAAYRAAFVIADNPCRKKKYLQALGLALPCLHYSYIINCISAKKLLDIRPYILAAGEGKIGADLVWMSMVCQSLDCGSIANQIAERRQIWSGKNIIVVTGPSPETRQVHLFLSWAMGCADLTECFDIAEAHRLFTNPEDNKTWDFISVQDFKDGYHDLTGHVVTNEDVVQSLITGQICKH